jgi:hypothetical protein
MFSTIKKFKYNYFSKVIIYSIKFIGYPITFLSTLWLKFIVLSNTGKDKLSEGIFMFLGILPVRDHYYQPLINPKKYITKDLNIDRNLSAIDFNIPYQLELLEKFNFNNELIRFPIEKLGEENRFFYNNGTYCSGDAEFLYSIIRHFKPLNIIEVGCGNSTLMIRNAIDANQLDNNDYQVSHLCIEPYEQPWLENLNIELVRDKVENIDLSFFKRLNKDDILFIDSSHIIKPQGDVLYEILQILPNLNSGVIVHFHDIFTPKDYLSDWILNNHCFWNEQYILEAFLSYNSEFKIIGALNFLSHNYNDLFSNKCPIYAKQNEREPGGFWIQKC